MASRPTSTRLDPTALGAAAGATWALAVAALGVSARFGRGEAWRSLLATVYVGYDEHVTVGVAWALVDGFAGGYLLGRFYNAFARR